MYTNTTSPFMISKQWNNLPTDALILIINQDQDLANQLPVIPRVCARWRSSFFKSLYHLTISSSSDVLVHALSRGDIIFPSLHSLKIQTLWAPIIDRTLQLLCSAPSPLAHLKALTLSDGKRITANGFRLIAGCKNLQHLEMYDCYSITDEVLDEICTELAETLRELHLINRFPNPVYVPDGTLTADGLSSIKKLKHLYALSVVNWMAVSLWPDFDSLQNLQMLSIRKSKKLAGGLQLRSGRLLSLRQLNVAYLPIDDVALGKFVQTPAPNLVELDLTSTEITDLGISYLRSFRETLEVLVLSRCRALTDDSLQHVANLANLRRLDLFWTAVTDEGMSYLINLPFLEMLTVGACTAITSASVNYWKEVPSLTYLSLEYCDHWREEDVALLSSLSNLVEVNINGCSLLNPEIVGRHLAGVRVTETRSG
eukprot:TRINITY_DN8082_c0_g1_i1.p1 TRINITY_DN8082_c0_g1~~TRINITY_DN8082_c0_g1_i1.p1  ORF type:complete len:427 (+),score=40.66 TRINITY_DN8082_c0_g1_i1:34-1314(+)